MAAPYVGPKDSFWAPITESPREDFLKSLENHIFHRNGGVDAITGFTKRKQWIADSKTWNIRHNCKIDTKKFNDYYNDFRVTPDLTEQLLAILTFTKVNASESYAVDVVKKIRFPDSVGKNAVEKLELILMEEEKFHTQILIGATNQFELPEPVGAWLPRKRLRFFMHGMARVPGHLYPYICLAAEIFGLFVFNWMIERIGEVFHKEPQLRDSLQHRLVEIMIDEVGHLTFHRMLVGSKGLFIPKALLPFVAAWTCNSLEELNVLGFNREVLRRLNNFDFAQLPEEVRQRTFFA